jgi:hypothetical protein
MVDIGRLRYGSSVSYKMEHNTASLLGGLIMLLGGFGMWKYLGEYHWLEAVLISFGALLLGQYVLIRENDAFTYKMYFKWQIYWIGICAGYFLLPLSHWTFNIRNYNPYRLLFGNNSIDKAIAFIGQYNLDTVGFAGLALCAFWILREWILRALHRR